MPEAESDLALLEEAPGQLADLPQEFQPLFRRIAA